MNGTASGSSAGPSAGSAARAAAQAADTLPPLPAWPVLDADTARRFIAAMQARLAAAGLTFRAPPPEPDPLSCCGRGCVGCVWSGFYDALGFWREDALAALAAA